MYQITLYSLIAYILFACLFSFFNIIQFSIFEILLGTAIAVVTCYVSNFVFAKLFHAVTNFESVFITALILTVIIPLKLPLDAGLLVGASVLAMAAKYLPTINKQHIFNPAAAGVAAYAMLFPNYSATWWIGTPYLFIPVVLGGFLVTRKAQRGRMVLTFLAFFFLIIGASSFIRTGILDDVYQTLRLSLIQTAVIFFATIMLTEPITSPATKTLRGWYAVLVAILYATPQTRLFGFIVTPEMALLYGNIFSYIVSPKYRLALPLIKVQKLSPTIYVFTFPKDKSFTFKPGQYMEWTLPHPHMDSRGNRRFLSMASSPTEDTMLAAIRYYTPPSSYKKFMIDMKPGDKIVATNLSGDFVLPKNIQTPMVFVAGGVGITPFRSMLKYIIDKKIQANIVLLFINKTEDEIVFQDVFKEAEQYGVKTINVITGATEVHSGEEKGHVTEEMIARTIPDYKSRTFYISGSQLMVQNLHDMFRKMGIKKIKVDFFPGYTEK